jgi:hypothetical protein
MREIVVKQLENKSEKKDGNSVSTGKMRDEEQIERENKIRVHSGKIFGRMA